MRFVITSWTMDFLRGFGAFLDYRYWLNPAPVPLGPSLVSSILSFFAWFVVVSLVLAVLARWVRKSYPHASGVSRQFSNLFAWTGVLGLLFLFFTYEQIPLLGMRLWFLLIFAYFGYRLGKIAWYLVREYPAERREDEERERIEKYLTKRK